MQNNERFGELHNVCFNEENYPYDIFNLLEPFRQKESKEKQICVLPYEVIPDDFLEFQVISNEVKQRLERDISPIQSKDFNGITTAFFSNPYIGDWYLKEINENSIVGYHNGIPKNSEWLWCKSAYNLKYKEDEIVYCIMQKLSKYYQQNKRFEIEFNKYKGFFDGTLEEFLDCLINEYKDSKFYHSSVGQYYMNKIEGYEGLHMKLIDKLNNLSTPEPKVEAQGDDIFNFDKEIEILMKSENKFHKCLPMHFVINHFKVFYENNKKTEYLSKENFISFIKRGFLNDDTQPIQKMNLKYSEKGLIIKQFFEFFVKARGTYSYPNRKKGIMNLIMRCFDNLGEYSAVFSCLANKTNESL